MFRLCARPCLVLFALLLCAAIPRPAHSAIFFGPPQISPLDGTPGSFSFAEAPKDTTKKKPKVRETHNLGSSGQDGVGDMVIQTGPPKALVSSEMYVQRSYISGMDMYDFNADSARDLVLVHGQPGLPADFGRVVEILQSVGDSVYVPVDSIPVDGADQVAVADLDGDGVADLVVSTDATGASTPAITVELRKSVQWEPHKAPGLDLPEQERVTRLAVGDLDLDGYPDILVAHGNTLSVLYEEPGGIPLPPVDFPQPGPVVDMAVADLNGDGIPDLVVANGAPSDSDGVGIYLGLGGRTFKPRMSSAHQLTQVNVRRMAVGDLDGDGYPELVLALDSPPGAPTLVAGKLIGGISHGTESITMHYDDVDYQRLHLDRVALSIGDLFGDGRPAIEVLSRGPDELRSYRQIAGTTAARLTGLEADALPGGGVRVRWNVSGAVGGVARVLRSNRSGTPGTPVSADLSVASEFADLEFVDASALPGTEYYYRVQLRSGSSTTESGAVHVQTPAASLSLSPITPNPSSGRGRVSYSLPVAGDVQLRLYTVSGRAVATLEQGRREAGPHAVFLDAGRLSAGVYYVRLQQGERSIQRKLVVVH